jgi:hypothetical protein
VFLPEEVIDAVGFQDEIISGQWQTLDDVESARHCFTTVEVSRRKAKPRPLRFADNKPRVTFLPDCPVLSVIPWSSGDIDVRSALRWVLNVL